MLRTISLLSFILAGVCAAAAQVLVAVQPRTVFIENSAGRQLVSFDFRVENKGREEARVSRITVSVLDRRGELQARKFLETGVLRHSAEDRIKIEPGGSAYLYNPFLDFPAGFDLAELRYEFSFEFGADDKEATATAVVRPVNFTPKAMLRMPVKGRILVHDGHDYFAHHRRFSLAEPFLKEIGVTKNFTRYASDLVIVNEKGDMRRNAGRANEDWYGFGATLYAPAAGRVVMARNTVDDNIDGKATFTLDQFRSDPTTPAGNFLMIDHGNGEVSLLAHCKKGSVLVKVGDTVRAGQPVAQMGVSGDAYLPHLHYELRDAAVLDADGLPAYFHNFTRVLGERRIRVAKGTVNSGDILDVR